MFPRSNQSYQGEKEQKCPTAKDAANDVDVGYDRWCLGICRNTNQNKRYRLTANGMRKYSPVERRERDSGKMS